ncbi:E3 ubiquitin/ISG15 ligase TRIM25-like [Hyperolius riggenbachi]|uniref:E3 ubiquitin/ISG15 ligase TRIM25-like n=1 Tax=Hyperolius riggenbachi TaxID=752182 RepID=UPI0035A3D360
MPLVRERIRSEVKAAMASAAVREELDCAVCLNIYTDPVTLSCGHNFCRGCIDRVLDTQAASGVYSCPECREECLERPALRRNVTLRNIAEQVLSAQPSEEPSEISCTYCDSSVPAVRTCLLCEASLCAKHLEKHIKSPEHVLITPTASLENRKCSVHKEALKYFCTVEDVCICVSCCLAGTHKGHQVTSLEEASDKKKENIRNILQTMGGKSKETEKSVEQLKERSVQVLQKATGETERVTSLFGDFRKRLDALEEKVLTNGSQQEKKISNAISDMIQELEIKNDRLSRRMRHLEELSNTTDPLTVLQDSAMEASYVPGEDDNEDIGELGDLDEGLITASVRQGLSDLLNPGKDSVDLLLDPNTAANSVLLSGDLKCATYTQNDQDRPKALDRFHNYQAVSCASFTSGKHYWEVEMSKFGECLIGVAYPSTPRVGSNFWFGKNNKSWCLKRDGGISAVHDNKDTSVIQNFPRQKIGVYLDYQAGRLSFYDLCEPIQHLHTFTATFTEPLHAASYGEAILISSKNTALNLRLQYFVNPSPEFSGLLLHRKWNCKTCLSEQEANKL